MDLCKKILFVCTLLFFSTASFAEMKVELLAKGHWLLIKSQNFSIVTDLDEEIGRSLAEDLERYRSFSIEILHKNLVTKAKPLTILAISKSNNFKHLGLPGYWAGVFHIDELSYSAITNVEDYKIGLKNLNYGRQVLFHEYNHFLVRLLETTTIYPPWYDEGAAEYFGTFKFDGKKITLGDPHVLQFRFDGLYNNVGALRLELEQLLKTTNLPIHSKNAKDKEFLSRFYGRAFTVVHYFNSSAELRTQLNNYLDNIAKGFSVDDAFKNAFNTNFVDMERKIEREVFKSLYLRVINVPDGNAHFQIPEISVTTLDQAGFYAATYEVLLNFEEANSENAKKLLEKTLSLNPNLLDAKVQMLLHGFSNDFAKDAQEITKAAPQTSLSYFLQGLGFYNQANMMQIAGKQEWIDIMKQARSLFRRAIKVDGTANFAYGALGDVYKFLPDTEPLQEAAVCLDTAAIHRRDQSVFENLALINIRRNKPFEVLLNVRSALAFTKEKGKSDYALLLNNLEILSDTQSDSGNENATGLVYQDGGIYEGAVQNGKPHGKGKFIRPNGAYFEGQFEKGVLTGQGKLVSEFNEIYEGEFQKGIASGKAKIIYADSTYLGDVHYTLRHGKGVFNSELGSYEGEFWYGMNDGLGNLKIKNSTATINGHWIKGRYQWPQKNDLIFTGYIDPTGKATGLGICEDSKAKRIDWCEFKDGAKKEHPEK